MKAYWTARLDQEEVEMRMIGLEKSNPEKWQLNYIHNDGKYYLLILEREITEMPEP